MAGKREKLKLKSKKPWVPGNTVHQNETFSGVEATRNDESFGKASLLHEDPVGDNPLKPKPSATSTLATISSMAANPSPADSLLLRNDASDLVKNRNYYVNLDSEKSFTKVVRDKRLKNLQDILLSFRKKDIDVFAAPDFPDFQTKPVGEKKSNSQKENPISDDGDWTAFPPHCQACLKQMLLCDGVGADKQSSLECCILEKLPPVCFTGLAEPIGQTNQQKSPARTSKNVGEFHNEGVCLSGSRKKLKGSIENSGVLQVLFKKGSTKELEVESRSVRITKQNAVYISSSARTTSVSLLNKMPFTNASGLHGEHSEDSAEMFSGKPSIAVLKKTFFATDAENKAYNDSKISNTLLQSCPLCQHKFGPQMNHVEIDAHIAGCLSVAEDEVTW